MLTMSVESGPHYRGGGRICQRFRHIPNALEELSRAVLADNLHVLVFLDIGLDPIMSQLAALRLSPIQCMAWDQPVTSGLPTIDYFLSSALAEPETRRTTTRRGWSASRGLACATPSLLFLLFSSRRLAEIFNSVKMPSFIYAARRPEGFCRNRMLCLCKSPDGFPILSLFSS